MRAVAKLLPVVIAAVAATIAVAGCGGDSDTNKTSETTETTEDQSTLSGGLTVFAAASLTEAFTELGEQFEAKHRNVDVTFNFAASSALAQQVLDGAPADVFVSADQKNMAKVVGAGGAAAPDVMARNRLTILVEPGNPKDIRGLGDVARNDVVLVVCAPEVPCGTFAAAAFAKAGVTPKPSSLEENVKAVASKVILGEADAGIVYTTDARAAGDKVEAVDIDIADDPDLEATYPIALTSEATNADAGRTWIEFVLADEGQATLSSFGFRSP